MLKLPAVSSSTLNAGQAIGPGGALKVGPPVVTGPALCSSATAATNTAFMVSVVFLAISRVADMAMVAMVATGFGHLLPGGRGWSTVVVGGGVRQPKADSEDQH